jgi:ubiquinone/menaquinone biosynthesis C-methylase UbiE
MSEYALGNLDTEHERLRRQADRLAADTERLFREAGIGAGQRVLDLGAGTGAVALLAARLVGPSGEVVGIERDPRTIERARSEASAADMPNVRFVEADVGGMIDAGPFDAVVGRFILCWVPDPGAVLRQAATVVRPGGVMAFQEPWQGSVLALLEPLPLWHSAVQLLREVVRQSGGDPDIGAKLYGMFQDAGFADASVRQEVAMGRSVEFARGIVDSLRTLRQRIVALNLSAGALGNLDTLAQRLVAEVEVQRGVSVASPSPISIWARRT